MKKEILIVFSAFSLMTCILLSILFIAGCSESSKSSTTQTQVEEKPYSEQTVPLSGTTTDELTDMEITPSGDPKCFLSPCDCNCYKVENVPLTAKKVTCGLNCREMYKINGCVFRNYECSTLK